MGLKTCCVICDKKKTCKEFILCVEETECPSEEQARNFECGRCYKFKRKVSKCRKQK